MIRKVLGEWVSYFGIYNVYLNVVEIASTWKLRFVLDTDLVPFFLILAVINVGIATKKNIESTDTSH